jgi:hypothetical protein
MKLINDVKPSKEYSAYVEAPFDSGLKELKILGYRLISLEENARLRIQQGKNAFISRNGNWVREGSLYVRGKGRFITKNSPVLEETRKATQAHREENEFFVSNEQIERALEDSVQIPYEVSSIPTSKFGEEEIVRFCFGEIAEEYGEFLKEAGISEMPLWFDKEEYIEEQEKPYANQLWLSRLVGWSELYGFSWILSFDSRSRGVK